MSKFYSTTEAAKICQVTPGSVIRWIKEGKLETSLTAGGHRRIPSESLFSLLKKLRLPIPSELTTEEESATPRIMIIDDEVGMRQMLRWFLKENMPEVLVEEAENGLDAGWKALQFHPDLVLLDLFMPGMDGFRFCELIKGNPELKDTRILVMSGHQTEEVRDKINQLGVDVMYKPMDVDVLKQKILQELKRRIVRKA